MRKFFHVVFVLLAMMLTVSPAQTFAQENQISDGKTVTLNYTLTIDGQVLESSEGKEPLEYEHGSGKIIPGLESRLVGLVPGDEKTIVIPAKDGYGEIREDAYREIAKTTLPEGFEPQQGMIIEVSSPEGEPIPAIIWEVKEETIVLNFNHPLAGKTLQFDVQIVSVK